MSRLLKVLSFAGMSSVYLMQTGVCTLDGKGINLLPNVGTFANLGSGLGL
jgi:hypothetical protein